MNKFFRIVTIIVGIIIIVGGNIFKEIYPILKSVF